MTTTTVTLIAPGATGARFVGATVEEAVKAAGLRATGGTAYVEGVPNTLTMDEHFCLAGAGITLLTWGAPPALPEVPAEAKS